MRMNKLWLLLVTLGVILSLAACGSKATPVEEAAPTPKPAGATPTPKLKAEATPTPAAEKTKPPAIPSGADGVLVNPEDTLDSYRMRTTMRLLEGEGLLGEDFHTEMEWVREPLARRTVMYGLSEDMAMEIIIIGDDTWMNMGDDTWIKTESGPSDQESIAQEDLQASMEDILRDMEGGMKPAGKDTVNGVRCQRYTVDADFSMPMPVPEDASAEALQFMPTEMVGRIQGEICVADQRGLPPVIIRSQTTQEMTLKYASGNDETMVYEEERDLYDINKPITIEPPEGAMEMPSLPTPSPGEQATPQAEQPGASVEVASLDDLDSYRLDWSVQMQMSAGGEMEMSYTMEWVREPPARRLVMSIGGGPFGEYTWIGDTVWAKMGDTWIQATEEDAADAFDQLGDVMTPDSDMVLVGEETVNGVHCKHYVCDFGDMMHKEIWVADQSDLPSVAIRGMFRMKTTQMITEAEGNVYDINTPITIETPK